MDYFRKNEFGDRYSGYKSFAPEASTNKIRAHTTFEYEISAGGTDGSPDGVSAYSETVKAVGYDGGGANAGGQGYSLGRAESSVGYDELAEKQMRQAEGVRILYQQGASILPREKGGAVNGNASRQPTGGVYYGASADAANGGFGLSYDQSAAQRNAAANGNVGRNEYGQPANPTKTARNTPQRERPESFVDYALRKINAEMYGANYSAGISNQTTGDAVVNNSYSANYSAGILNQTTGGTAVGNAYSANYSAGISNQMTGGTAVGNNSAYGVNNAPGIYNSGANVSRLPSDATLKERLFYGSGSSDFAPDFFENSISTVRSDFDRREEVDKLYREHAEKVALNSYEEKAEYIFKAVKDNRNGEILNPEIDDMDSRFESAPRTVSNEFGLSASGGFERVDVDPTADTAADGSIRVVNPSRTRDIKPVVKRGAYDLDEDFNDAYEDKKASKIKGFFKSFLRKKDATEKGTGLTGLGKFVVGVYIVILSALAVFIISNQMTSKDTPFDSVSPTAIEIALDR
jgi:hypothetical protein